MRRILMSAGLPAVLVTAAVSAAPACVGEPRPPCDSRGNLSAA